MKSSDRNLNLTSYDEIFQTEETRIEASLEKVIDIPFAGNLWNQAKGVRFVHPPLREGGRNCFLWEKHLCP